MLLFPSLSLSLSLDRRVLALNGANDAMSDADLNTIVDQRQVSVPASGADEDVRCINKVMQVSKYTNYLSFFIYLQPHCVA
jgi:hypothetical protein